MELPSKFIEKDFVVGHMEDVDLSDLPVIPHGMRTVTPALIGYINRCHSYENYAFGITNNYGIDANAMSCTPVQLYIDKREWIENEDIKENKWIVFELIKQPSRTRHKAIQVRYLRPTLEDYAIAKNYVGDYSLIQGQIQGIGFSERIKVNIGEEITKLFFSSAEGKQLILNDLYQRKSEDSKEWNTYLSHLSIEEKETFVLDESLLTPTAELRLTLCSQLGKVDWLLHPSVIAYFNSNCNTDVDCIENLLNRINKDEDKQKVFEYIANNTMSSIILREKLFLLSFSLSVYNSIPNKENLIRQCVEQGAEKVSQLFLFHLHNLPDSDTRILSELLSKDILVSALIMLEYAEAYQFLIRLEEQFALDIITTEFRNTELFTLYIGDKWNSLKSVIPYIAFDLESDGVSINQFAFITEDNIRTYDGEDQLNSLMRKLKGEEIIVGHNIKQWDLPILEKKGLKTKAYVWDTLEMEILLNPCRYAYSLHTSHNAEDDTKLVNDLFWNQLFRLSEDVELVKQLRPILPTQINEILQHLQVDYFADYFKSSAKLNQHFFQGLRPLGGKLEEKFKEIDSIPVDEPTLIIAPENLWARIAQMVHVEFPVVEDRQKYLSVDANRLSEHPLDSIIEQKILERFCVV